MADAIAAHGRNGQISFDGKTVTIKREGLAARLSHGRGEKNIPLRMIAAVQMKPVTFATTGFIQFTVPGEISTTTAQKGKRGLNAAQDENSVLFLKKQEPEFIALRDAIQEAMATLNV